MKDYFNYKRGWIALGIFVAALVGLGFTRMLTRQSNPTLILIFIISVVIMAVLNSKPKQ